MYLQGRREKIKNLFKINVNIEIFKLKDLKTPVFNICTKKYI